MSRLEFKPQDRQSIDFAEEERKRVKEEGKISHEGDILATGQLIAEITTKSQCHEIVFNNLDIANDGGVYDFVIVAPTIKSNPCYPSIRINDIAIGYSKSTIFTSNSDSIIGVITASGYFERNQESFGIGNMIGDTMCFGTITLKNGVVGCSTRMANTSNNYCSTYFNDGFINANNVTTIKFMSSLADTPYPSGTTIKLFKRATNSPIRS